MPPPSSSDTRFLEAMRGKWRVTVPVPRALHAELGTRLKRSLNTDSLAAANRLKWPVVAELKAEIERARRPGIADPDTLAKEAETMATRRAQAASKAEVETLDEEIVERSQAILGSPIGETESPFEPRPVPVYDPVREARADAFYAVASGTATPLDLYHQRFVDQNQTKLRTKADDARALKFLMTWCRQKGVTPTIQAINRRTAARFMDDLPTIAGGRGPVTLNKYLHRLSRYWQWLLQRDLVEADVWAKLKIQPPKVVHGEEERAFTDDEVRRLLAGHARPEMQDLMRIAALTGARLDVVVDLKVKDCADGLFTFKPQKKETKARAVPIHSALKEIVTRRMAGKAPEDDVFPEWPGPKKAGSLRERSFKASNAFTTYRRDVGVDERVEGKRRALVNFHSFRRWFITKAERADQPESIIAVVVGHKRQGMTLGRYSSGPLIEQARRCVEAVTLPQQHERPKSASQSLTESDAHVTEMAAAARPGRHPRSTA